MNWKANILTTDAEIAELLRETKRIAVLGIKPEDHAGQPAFYVPKYMQAAGCEIVPVPVYYPDVTEILGQKVYRRLADIPGEVDMINVFRKSKDVFQHAPYDTHGFRSPNWVGFQYDSADTTPKSYPGLPGEWTGTPYDFVRGGEGLDIPGLPQQVVECLDGT